ncbi:hypothetical protein [Sporolactobacillus pectinivorans]|uniref:hypothetical protein n=1 Tax=Sporolactobacillus pectinivorans TaxID=1591408 RepID=UPI0012FDC7FF|nr:hypothetical protein [Sporolactobacillus pectinivorans]
MDEIRTRIDELKHIQAVSKRNGLIVAERWAHAEIAEMKVALKKMKRASWAKEAL